MKSEARNLAELIQAKTGESLVTINAIAIQMVMTGLSASMIEALNCMLEEVTNERRENITNHPFG